MSDPLRDLARDGVLAPLDAHFARGLATLVPETPEPVLFAVALVSRAAREGHACLALDRLAVAGDSDLVSSSRVTLPDAATLSSLLEASALVGDGSRVTPLVLDRGRLYLTQHWRDERALATGLLERARLHPEPLGVESARESLSRLFGSTRPGVIDGQRVAAQVAALRALTVITGGPGTGKTTTVARIAALLVEQAFARGLPPPRILLLAPTGKAASRLAESVGEAKRRLAAAPGVLDAIPASASTLHRALGLGRGGAAPRGKPSLAADLVVVDEASMVDLALMRRLVAAVPAAARLVLLGDPHQLASVAAGAVLADLSGPTPRPPPSRALGQAVWTTFGEELPGVGDGPGGLADSIVELTYSHRFSPSGGLGRLAAAVLGGDPEAAVAACDGDAVTLIPSDTLKLGAEFAATVGRGFAAYLAASDPLAALAGLERFRVLAAHRHGGAGIEGVGRRIERDLATSGGLRVVGEQYHRRPVLVTENDIELGVWNGDTGVVWAPHRDAPARVWLRRADGTLRSLGPARLPPHLTAFVASVHRSQGSEFDTVACVLPDASSPLLSRELVYTAVTRARERVTLFASEASLRGAVVRSAERATGLGELLWRVP